MATYALGCSCEGSCEPSTQGTSRRRCFERSQCGGTSPAKGRSASSRTGPAVRNAEAFSYFWLAGNEGIRALYAPTYTVYIPFKELYIHISSPLSITFKDYVGYLIPPFPASQQYVLGSMAPSEPSAGGSDSMRRV